MNGLSHNVLLDHQPHKPGIAAPDDPGRKARVEAISRRAEAEQAVYRRQRDEAILRGIQELHDRGYTYKTITRLTGVSESMIFRLMRQAKECA